MVKQEKKIKESKIRDALVNAFERYKDKQHNWIENAIKDIADDLNIKVGITSWTGDEF